MIKKRLPFFFLLLCLAGFRLSGQIVINEINYHSAADLDSKDWVEFYNSNGSQVNIGNWSFSDDNDANLFTFPAGTTIPGNGYLVLVRNIDSFALIFPDVINYVGEFDFGLNNGGELLRLFNASGTVVDTVHFDDEDPWPTDPDGLGATLQLLNPSLDNALAGSWFSAPGTPGAPNTPNIIEDPNFSFGLEIFPNPFTSPALIRINSSNMDVNGDLVIYNSQGAMIKTIPWNGGHQMLLDVPDLPGGLYTLVLKQKDRFAAQPLKFVITR
ncbi:MAG: lamin tail domain-containing protein [Saprospiraceae bacterium]|nr:lamin tail domain-containing protein [Saprospiraceae bacterium]MCB9324474.1 lamin tail domain-containing protein [Lewinellaceae bacterium]